MVLAPVLLLTGTAAVVVASARWAAPTVAVAPAVVAAHGGCCSGLASWRPRWRSAAVRLLSSSALGKPPVPSPAAASCTCVRSSRRAVLHATRAVTAAEVGGAALAAPASVAAFCKMTMRRMRRTTKRWMAVDTAKMTART